MITEKRYSSKGFNSILHQWMLYLISLTGYFHSCFINHEDIFQFIQLLKMRWGIIHSKASCLSTSTFPSTYHLQMDDNFINMTFDSSICLSWVIWAFIMMSPGGLPVVHSLDDIVCCWLLVVIFQYTVHKALKYTVLYCYSICKSWSLFSQLPMSIIKNVFWELDTDYILSSALCPSSPWSEEISSITRLFSARQYSNMPWINTGSMWWSPVGVTLKGLTLWLPSRCEGLERLPTFQYLNF